MKLIPAIDLLDGHCVRLLHGDFAQVTRYEVTALDLARQYADAGAGWLHVVDLAASRDGENTDISALIELLKRAPQQVQTGGGVRAGKDITLRLDAGASRVVIGSLSVTDSHRFISWLDRYGPEKLVAALDILFDDKGSSLAQDSWLDFSGREEFVAVARRSVDRWITPSAVH